MASSLRMRPQFKRHLPCSPAAAQRTLKRHVDQAEGRVQGDFYSNHAVLCVPPAEEHFWSPQLSIDFASTDAGTDVRGLFGPRPSVWTMFMASYAFAAFGGTIGITFGLAQWSLGMAAPALWAGPAAAVMAAATYGLALLGRALSRDQVETLRTVADAAWADCAASTAGSDGASEASVNL